MSAGIDVRAWLAEGLLDILVVGQAMGNRHRLPVEEYVEAASGTGVQVIAQNLGLFGQSRSFSARLLWNERDYYSTEMCRAVAASHWRAGADGIYLFNNHLIPFTRDLDYDRQPWKEMADPDPHRPQGQALPGGSARVGRGPPAGNARETWRRDGSLG